MLFLVACRNDNSIKNNKNISVILETQVWLENQKSNTNKSPIELGSKITSGIVISAIDGVLDWGNANVEWQKDGTTFTNVPILKTSGMIFHGSITGFKRLIVFGYEKGIKQGFIVEVDYEDKSINENNFNLNTFNGRIVVGN